jgi:hypothetical protein
MSSPPITQVALKWLVQHGAVARGLGRIAAARHRSST